jgi:ribosomal protein S18 acetylase RimI-like enzyme
MDIRELTPALVDDYLAFFDGDAFADNPEWAACYCRFFLWDGDQEGWAATTAADNRPVMIDLVRRGVQQGLLAYDGAKPVAWCQAMSPSYLSSLGLWLQRDAAADTGALTCFIVAAAYRRRGVARSLMDAALERFRGAGLSWAEAYPRRHGDDSPDNYPGPLSMYLQAGFTIEGDLPHNRHLVRKRLA